ncbi:ribosome recycling factor, partial [Methylobacterium radiotolerans]
MEKAVEVAKEDFASIRTGRANPALYAKVMVDYYGTPTPLQQLASFQVSRRAGRSSSPPYDKSALRYEKMEKAVEVAKEDFASIRTGRANPALYAKVMV